MKINIATQFLLQLIVFGSLQAQTFNHVLPVIDSTIIFEEQNKIVSIEAEYFFKQDKSELRQWYNISKHRSPKIIPINYENHASRASNSTYLKILPDTRITYEDELIQGENFSNEPGILGVLHYKVKINNPGRYYIWVRAFSTGSEDNGLHVGLNNKWPTTGQRMQWCDGKNEWTWDSKQRTKEEHCGVPHQIYLDIERSGIHDIQFSMREDGFEFDKFIMTQDINYMPIDNGPQVVFKWPNISYFEGISTSHIENKTLPVDDFPIENTNYYRDAANRWLAINPNKHKEAETSTIFNFMSGKYDVVFVGVGENDGQSTFTVSINDKELGTFSPALIQKMFKEGSKFNYLWENIKLKKGDKITVFSKIGSTDGKEWARARWSGLIFTPVGKGKQVKATELIFDDNNTENTTTEIKPPPGHLAIVADGNSPDPDDLGATAVSISLLRATGLEDRLVHYSHSCDLVRVERISVAAERERHGLMQSACDVTARRWGGFENLTFFDAKWQQDETVRDLSKAINASSKNDPLWIIEAGEPDIIGMALEASKKSKHKYVKVITHHPANDDAGDFYTWQQILNFGVEEVRIPDQNVNLKMNLENWDWAKNHPDPRIQWIWLQGKIAEIDNVVKFQKGKWDCSDAGMLLYWITGATNNGLENGKVDHIKQILLEFITQKQER